MKKILFIEDKDQEINLFRNLFKENKDIKFDCITPDLIGKYLAENKDSLPCLFLVDYYLIDNKTSNDSFDLFGGGIFNHLRHYFKEYPIILFSRYQITNKSLIDMFDYYISKEKLTENLQKYTGILIDIIETFQDLRKIQDRSRNKLFNLLDIHNTSEEDDIISSALPLSSREWLSKFSDKQLSEPNIDELDEWNIPDLLKWIDRILFAYPGILYDSIHAATHLRLSENDFKNEKIQKLFQKAKYNGIFKGLEEHWWKGRLEEIAFAFLKNNDMKIDLDYFPDAIEKKNQIKLEKSICVCCGKDKANTICYVLKKPTQYEHSLQYYPDNRPGVMEIARVSYQAILDGNKYNPNYIRTGFEIIRDIIQIMKKIRDER